MLKLLNGQYLSASINISIKKNCLKNNRYCMVCFRVLYEYLSSNKSTYSMYWLGHSVCSAISIWASDELSQVNSLLLKPSVIEEKEQNDCKQQNSNEQSGHSVSPSICFFNI